MNSFNNNNTTDVELSKLGSIQLNKKPADVVFKNVTYRVTTGRIRKKEKIILKGVSGSFRSGELTAIMGPSGAGKSSLLNVLTGFNYKGIGGVITTMDPTKRNLEFDKHISEKCNVKICRKNSCYIMQDDLLCPLFTANEIMNMAANLKLGHSLSKKCKQLMIKDIMEKLGLTANANTRCGMLSGGQKKRLSIALELIDNPTVMFLDEPTTGLDSRSSNMCISILRNLSKMGRTIVCTIHQPSATLFEMFDHVYVIAEGYCVYQGSCYNVVPYLQTIGLYCPQYHNPADFLMEIVNGDFGHFTKQLVSAASSGCWRSTSVICSYESLEKNNVPNSDIRLNNGRETRALNSLGNDLEMSNVHFKAPAEYCRLFTLIDRCIIKLYRDWTASHLKMALHFFVGVLLGVFYSRCGIDGSKSFSNIGFLIMSLVYLSYTSLMPAILKFPNEFHTLRKEEFNNWYKLSTFYAAHLITNIPIQMMSCLIYSAAAYYLSSQILVWSRFIMFLVVCQLITLLSEGFGLILGTCLSPVNGVFVGAVMTCFFILFAGYVVLFAHMPTVVYYFSFTSYFRYGFEALISAIYGGDRAALECPIDNTLCYFKYPKEIFEELYMKEERYYLDVFVLLLYFVVFTTISFFSLRRKIKS